ncbi:MAG: hypothetical protein HZB48_06735, partial [Actinobacteria bacterium]|nr:hypothetical protein [Actinomycetota bacterium]
SDAAADVVVTDTLPVGMTYVSSTGTGWSTSPRPAPDGPAPTPARASAATWTTRWTTARVRRRSRWWSTCSHPPSRGWTTPRRWTPPRPTPCRPTTPRPTR